MALFNVSDLKAKGRIIAASRFTTPTRILNESVQNFSANITYDIFLSHSISDAEIILGLKEELTSKGFRVYVDWIEDPQLNRANVTKDTAIYIQNRMKTCKSLLYATSNNSKSSKWMPWELGFFDGYRKKVAIIPISDTPSTSDDFKGQEYLGIYPYVVKDNLLWIRNNLAEYKIFDTWLRS